MLPRMARRGVGHGRIGHCFSARVKPGSQGPRACNATPAKGWPAGFYDVSFALLGIRLVRVAELSAGDAIFDLNDPDRAGAR